MKFGCGFGREWCGMGEMDMYPSPPGQHHHSLYKHSGDKELSTQVRPKANASFLQPAVVGSKASLSLFFFLIFLLKYS